MTTTPMIATAPDAIQLLSNDHREVKALFKAYQQLADADGDDEEKEQLAQEICTKLTVHADVEEELFYPAVRDVLPDEEDLVDEAAVEHACARELIVQIEQSAPDEPMYDAKVKVLGEYVDHHAREEEDVLFRKVQASGLDIVGLGQDMAQRMDELLADMADDA